MVADTIGLTTPTVSYSFQPLCVDAGTYRGCRNPANKQVIDFVWLTMSNFDGAVLKFKGNPPKLTEDPE